MISTSMKKRKKRTKRSISLVAAVAAVLIASPAVAKKKKPAAPPTPQAVIAGTVFREPGFALPGAKVTVRPEKKGEENQTVSSTRGEWAVRVAPVPMTYVVDVQASGYESQQKTVVIDGEEREELNFMLSPAKADPAGGKR